MVYSVKYCSDPHSDRDLVATGSFDYTARLWDAKTGRLVHILRGHTSEVHILPLSPPPHGTPYVTHGGRVTLRSQAGSVDYGVHGQHSAGVGHTIGQASS